MTDKERDTYDRQFHELARLTKDSIDAKKEQKKIADFLRSLDERLGKINTAIAGDELGNIGIIKRLVEVEKEVDKMSKKRKTDAQKTIGVAAGGSAAITGLIEYFTKGFG